LDAVGGLGAMGVRPRRRRSRYSAAWVLGLSFIGWAALLGIGRVVFQLL
jgi:hypothetical protein